MASDIFLNHIREAKKAVRMQDLSRAYVLYLTAAQNGHSEGQYQVANMLMLGSGIEVDKISARKWLEKSAAQDHPAALYKLSLELGEETENKDNSGRAKTLMMRAVDLEYPLALTYIKRRKGKDVFIAKDDERGSLWFGGAAKGDLDMLSRLHNEGVNINKTDEAGRNALFVASEFSHQSVLTWLVSRGANVNSEDNFSSTPLFVSAKNGDLESFRLLVESGADVHHLLTNGNNLWHYLVDLGKTSIADELFKYNVDVNHENASGWTALDLAHYKKDTKLISKLLSVGATRGSTWQTQERAMASTTPEQFFKVRGDKPVDVEELARIMRSGNLRLTKSVLQKYPDLSDQLLADGSTLLMAMASDGNHQMITILLQRKVNPNVSGASGLTALHIAARNGSLEIVNDLLLAGSKAEQLDDNGLDAVDWAIQEGHASIVMRILTPRRDRQSRSSHRYLLAAAEKNLTQLVKFLVSHVDFDAAGSSNRTATWHAANHDNIDMLRSLKDILDKDKADVHGRTPFFIAVERGCFICAEFLITPNNVQTQNVSGDTPLMVAAAKGNQELIAWLLNKNVDVEIRNKLGNTALIIATENENFNAVKQLVGFEAIISRKNELGFSALDIASRKNKEIYTFLKEQSVLGVF